MLTSELPLRTKRLLLRPYCESDLDFLHDMESHPDVVRYVSWPPRDREKARESLAKKIAETTLRTEGAT